MGVAGFSDPVQAGRRILHLGEGGLPEPIQSQPLAASGDAWSRISLEEHVRPPGEEKAFTPLQHTVVLNLGDPYRREHRWGDGPEVIRHTLHRGQVALFPAGMRFRTRWLDPAHILLLTLEPSLLAEVSGSPVSRPPRLRPVLGAQDELLAHLMLSLSDALSAHPRHAGAFGECLARALAVHLTSYIEAGGQQRGVRTGLRSRSVRRVTEHVDRHLEAQLSLQELARLADLSVFHFARSFKETVGLSPHQYVLRRRIDRAKRLLVESSLSLTEIAARCGFAHQSHFTKVFRRLSGVTPNRWREPSATRAN